MGSSPRFGLGLNGVSRCRVKPASNGGNEPDERAVAPNRRVRETSPMKLNRGKSGAEAPQYRRCREVRELPQSRSVWTAVLQHRFSPAPLFSALLLSFSLLTGCATHRIAVQQSSP